MFSSLRESFSLSLQNLLRSPRLTFGPNPLLSLQRIRSLSPGLDEDCSLQPASETLFPRRGGANVAAHCAPSYVSYFPPLCYITRTVLIGRDVTSRRPVRALLEDQLTLPASTTFLTHCHSFC